MDISVIIPVYNAEKFISKCLNSILQQKDSELSFEIIAINDGSKDNSLKILQEYSALYSNIKVVNSENKGAGSARNLGIQSAEGKYLWFIDADDYISEFSFKYLQDKVKQNKTDFIVFDYNVVRENFSSEVVNIFLDNFSLSDYFFNAKSLFLWKHLYRSELIKKNNLKFIEDIKNIEDFEYNIKFFMVAETIYYIKKPLYNYFENMASTSRDISKANLDKLAFDSQIVHRAININLDKGNQKNIIVKDLLSRSIVGFFYSLFKFGYTYYQVKTIYDNYKEENLIPVKIKLKNRKFSVFSFIVNKRYIYLPLTFIKKKIFN